MIPVPAMGSAGGQAQVGAVQLVLPPQPTEGCERLPPRPETWPSKHAAVPVGVGRISTRTTDDQK